MPPCHEYHQYRILALIIGLLGLFGCDRQTAITQYQAPKEQVARPAARSTGDAESNSASSSDQTAIAGRMLAAMVPHEKRVWFFKLLGPDEEVAEQVDAFHELLASISFDADRPSWKLPENWKEQAGSGMRFATLNAGQPGLDVSVISLPAPQDVLENVNRWQNQLQSPAFSKDQLAEASDQIQIDGEVATVVNLSGTLAPGGGGPPMMRGAGPFASGPSPGAGPFATNRPPTSAASGASPPVSNPGFEYTVPESWAPGRSGGIRKLAFVTDEDGEETELTVTTLGKAGAGVLPNVNRWRGQIGLEPIASAGLEDLTSEIDFSGNRATLIELRGKEKSMRVVMAERGNVVWFFKMMGSTDAITRQEKNFMEFIQSVKFPDN